MRVMQWNIGGARIRGIEDDPMLQESYKTESIEHVSSVIRGTNPDIITLQETHQAVSGSQAEQLSAELGYEYWVNDARDESHIEPGQLLGQAILSKFAIIKHTFQQLPNPELTITDESGELIHAYNYGLTTVELDTPDGLLLAHTWHLPALHFFGVETDSPQARKILETASNAVAPPTGPTIIPGDYNLNVRNVISMLPGMKRNGFIEATNDAPTTPRDKQLDHLVYYGLDRVRLSVIKTLADHFALAADIDF